MRLARITTATPRGTFHLGLGARRRGHHVDGRATVPRRERSRLVRTARQDGACAARLGVPSALRSARLAAARSCPRSAPSGPASPCLSKKQLRVGAARWLCSGYRPEGYARLGSYDRGLLTPARCADVPPPAREAGHTARGERAKTLNSAPLAGSDDAEARCAASRRRRGFAQGCGWRWSFDRGRSDPCSRHQQGSCGRQRWSTA